mmetsp:Transcript_2234/g.5750  ORF Transcript_2234/g.5750 Transcript_2234/m.5750 type:complete len:204 (-) Transcript_2234:212-823(-)|eukprot:CAMPEP_0119408380 /NCGR_PEP_ID=MMETSP1335-20130426/1934_1 /TAXON_ID=259385 /ORGANISM="Chrysoculter rhomboideus, Strain RCC1486" /LENGTH=203 /DNA_ID=CAMNT_0007432603 /DNA_START=238 /DNA_END=849 /DNA_ORIENTATION=-
MTISDQLPTNTTKATTSHTKPNASPSAHKTGKHQYATQSTLEDVLGGKRRSVSELVADEYRHPFTLDIKQADDTLAQPVASSEPTAAEVARGLRPHIERERRASQHNAAKGFLHANPTGVAGVSADVALYAEASTVGAGGHATPKLPEAADSMLKKATAQTGATRRMRSASMEAAELARMRETKLLRQAEQNLALHAEIEAAR